MTVRGRPRHPDVLTPREWAVFEHLREGRTNEEIAQRLGITLDGAKYHVSSILSKLGVSSRTEASRWQPAQPARVGFRGWSFLLALGKMTGVAVAASALLGVGVLGYGVLISESATGVADPASASTISAGQPLNEAPGRSGEPNTTQEPSSDSLTRQAGASDVVPPAAGSAVSIENHVTTTPGNPLVLVPPTRTLAPTPADSGCDDCNVQPTPTPKLQPPACEHCNVTPEPLGDPPQPPKQTAQPTLTPTATSTPTPTQTPPEPGEPTEDPQASETPEPSETLEPRETPEPTETPQPHDECVVCS